MPERHFIQGIGTDFIVSPASYRVKVAMFQELGHLNWNNWYRRQSNRI